MPSRRILTAAVAAVHAGALATWAAPGPVPVPGMAEFDLGLNFLKVTITLVLVIGLLLVTLWLFQKMLRVNRFPGIPGGAVRILEIRHIDPRRLITLVKVLDRGLVVGWTDHGVSLLGELTPEEVVRIESSPAPEPMKFGDILSRLTGKRGSGPQSPLSTE